MDPIIVISDLISKYPAVFWTILVCWIVSALLNLMPEPKPDSSVWYIWLHNIGQWLGANLKLIRLPSTLGPKPQEPPKD